MPKEERTSSNGSSLAARLKIEPTSKVAIKTEPRRGVKVEPQVKREQVNKEQPVIKSESASASNVKTEQRSAALPPLKAKIEQLRQVKAELKTKMDSDTDVADLVRRGLEIRAQAQNKAKTVKREKGKKRTGVKIKKERCLRLDGKPRRKQRVTAKRRNASREAMNRAIPLSDELAELLGISEASRPEAIRRLWLHCKENGMLNPDNKREVQFDGKLEQIMGTTTATLPQMMSLLVPHLDYVKAEQIKQEMKSEVKSESGKRVKTESHAAGASTGIKKQPVAGGTKTERREPVTTMREPILSVASPQKAKLEPMVPGPSIDAQSASEEALRAVVPRLAKFDKTTTLIQFAASSACNDLEAYAVPSTGSSDKQRAPCTMEFRESCDGSMALHVEALITGLKPTIAYQVFFQTKNGSSRSREVYLPQRANPAKWASRDVEVWCTSQHVPELLQMVHKYGIDGQTLLSLGEEDLKQSGLTVPFLLRRVLAGLEQLKNSFS